MRSISSCLLAVAIMAKPVCQQQRDNAISVLASPLCSGMAESITPQRQVSARILPFYTQNTVALFCFIIFKSFPEDHAP